MTEMHKQAVQNVYAAQNPTSFSKNVVTTVDNAATFVNLHRKHE